MIDDLAKPNGIVGKGNLFLTGNGVTVFDMKGGQIVKLFGGYPRFMIHLFLRTFLEYTVHLAHHLAPFHDA